MTKQRTRMVKLLARGFKRHKKPSYDSIPGLLESNAHTALLDFSGPAFSLCSEQLIWDFLTPDSIWCLCEKWSILLKLETCLGNWEMSYWKGRDVRLYIHYMSWSHAILYSQIALEQDVSGFCNLRKIYAFILTVSLCVCSSQQFDMCSAVTLSRALLLAETQHRRDFPEASRERERSWPQSYASSFRDDDSRPRDIQTSYEFSLHPHNQISFLIPQLYKWYS